MPLYLPVKNAVIFSHPMTSSYTVPFVLWALCGPMTGAVIWVFQLPTIGLTENPGLTVREFCWPNSIENLYVYYKNTTQIYFVTKYNISFSKYLTMIHGNIVFSCGP